MRWRRWPRASDPMCKVCMYVCYMITIPHYITCLHNSYVYITLLEHVSVAGLQKRSDGIVIKG